jgi:hypothetical protein
MVREGELLWTPRAAFVEGSNLHRYMQWLKRERGRDFSDYESLRRWSVTNIESFWQTIWDYFDVQSGAPYNQVLDRRVMPGAKWFEGSTVNYAEHLLRYESKAKPTDVAFHHISETRPLGRLCWSELGDKVRTLATRLRELGIKPSDRVVSYMPNLPETAVAMIATIAIGAVWSSAAPEFGVKTVTERFVQIEPKLLFAADGYRFGGKDFDRYDEVRAITAALPTLERVVWLPYLHEKAEIEGIAHLTSWNSLMDLPAPSRESFRFERVPHDHPIWILFSSGTTGLPKAIVHSHVGVLIEHLKLMNFHLGLGPGVEHVLLLHYRLDDVQSPDGCATHRVFRNPLRRQPCLPAAGLPLETCRRDRRDHVRRQPDFRTDDGEGRNQTGRSVRSLHAAMRHGGGGAFDAGDFRVVLQGSQRRPLGHIAIRRHGDLFGICRGGTQLAGLCRRNPDPDAWHGCPCVERRWQGSDR